MPILSPTPSPSAIPRRPSTEGSHGHRASAPQGLLIATSILGLWSISTLGLMSNPFSHHPAWLIPLAILWQMGLYTGLFITAHDAMHGSILPNHPRLNAWVGRLAVFAYGLFPYQTLLQKHWLHHHRPASAQDPDFHDGVHAHPVLWYLHFMKGYWGWQQAIGFSLVFYIARLGLHIPMGNLLAFWIAPSILSSIQLFYFGTFLPHRQPVGGYRNRHRAQTISLPVLWSFITCYHFGYHEEHHEYPTVPWWQLPTVHQLHTCMNRSSEP